MTSRQQLKPRRPMFTTTSHFTNASHSNKTITAESSSSDSRYFEDVWIWEFASWSVSAACIAAIIVILSLYNGRLLPEWPLGITLNAAVSVLSTIAHGAMLTPVTSCLSQLKWLWFSRRNHPLRDIAFFDDASRGPWGCLLLLWRLRRLCEPTPA